MGRPTKEKKGIKKTLNRVRRRPDGTSKPLGLQLVARVSRGSLEGGEGIAHGHFLPPSRQLPRVPSLSDRGVKRVKLEHGPRQEGRVLQARLVLNGTTVVRAASVAALPAE